jgi:hypothetical protein
LLKLGNYIEITVFLVSSSNQFFVNGVSKKLAERIEIDTVIFESDRMNERDQKSG